MTAKFIKISERTKIKLNTARGRILINDPNAKYNDNEIIETVLDYFIGGKNVRRRKRKKTNTGSRRKSH